MRRDVKPQPSDGAEPGGLPAGLVDVDDRGRFEPVLNLVYVPAESAPEGTYEDAKASLPQNDG